MLTNEIYTGTSAWGRHSKNPKITPVRCENAWEALVSRQDFEKVGKLLKERVPVVTHPRRTSSRYLLSGLAHWGICGKTLTGADAKNGKFLYYVCGTLAKKGHGSCSARYLNAQKFEKKVVEEIKSKVLTRENLRQMVSLVNEEMDGSSSDYKQQLENIEIELWDVSCRLEKLYDALETGTIELRDLSPRIKDLRKRQEDLHLAKDELESIYSDGRIHLTNLEFIEECVDALHELLSENSSLAERRSFIKSFVKDIRVSNDTVEIQYTIPLLPNDDRVSRIGVLPSVQYGGPWLTDSELLFERRNLSGWFINSRLHTLLNLGRE